jgi:SanA protein
LENRIFLDLKLIKLPRISWRISINKKRLVRGVVRMFLYLFIAGILLLGVPWLITRLYSGPLIHSVADAPRKRVAIVFGAGLRWDGTPSPVLEDRVATAAELYFAGKVEKILMSGDNRFIYYNEPGSMLNYALKLGVPREDIVLDYAGRRTYDTCYRAREIFGLTEALLVTQAFHLPRAVFTCNALGLPSEGVVADRRGYLPGAMLREIPANIVALWDVWLAHPLPVLGNPEPIFGQSMQPSTHISSSEEKSNKN